MCTELGGDGMIRRRLLSKLGTEEDEMSWEIIGEQVSDGNGLTVGLAVEVDMSKYKKIYIVAKAIGGTIHRIVLGNVLAWYEGTVILTNGKTSNDISDVGSAIANDAIMQVEINNILGNLYGYGGVQSGYPNASKSMIPFVHPRTNFFESSFKYVRLDANNAVLPEGSSLTLFGLK